MYVYLDSRYLSMQGSDPVPNPDLLNTVLSDRCVNRIPAASLHWLPGDTLDTVPFPPLRIS
jgi:hypothetical protein